MIFTPMILPEAPPNPTVEQAEQLLQLSRGLTAKLREVYRCLLEVSKEPDESMKILLEEVHKRIQTAEALGHELEEIQNNAKYHHSSVTFSSSVSY